MVLRHRARPRRGSQGGAADHLGRKARSPSSGGPSGQPRSFVSAEGSRRLHRAAPVPARAVPCSSRSRRETPANQMSVPEGAPQMRTHLAGWRLCRSPSAKARQPKDACRAGRGALCLRRLPSPPRPSACAPSSSAVDFQVGIPRTGRSGGAATTDLPTGHPHESDPAFGRGPGRRHSVADAGRPLSGPVLAGCLGEPGWFPGSGRIGRRQVRKSVAVRRGVSSAGEDGTVSR